MNLLTEGIQKGIVRQTDRATKLTIDGLTETYPIYQIKLEYLYFNDQNDRIATWLSKYKSENNVENFDRTDLEAYNSIIHEFIYKSNPDKIKTTQNNIEFIGQQKYGIVLRDGRIIDGNRRFTCLRNLAKDDPRFGWFESVILDKDIENNAKQIKMLELQVQIGEEERVDYDPIDRLVGVYNDLVENELLTIHEYAISTNAESDAEVEKLVERSKLLVDFLEAINAPKQFYIARELNINGPLVELQAILKKIKDEDRKEEIKYAVFTNFFMQPEGDMTRFIRNLKQIATSPTHMEEFIEKESVIAEKVLDNLPSVGNVTLDTIREARKNEEIKEELSRTMDVVTNKVKVTATRNKPAQILGKVVDSLEAIDSNIFKKLSDDQLEEIVEKLNAITELVDNLREEIDV